MQKSPSSSCRPLCRTKAAKMMTRVHELHDRDVLALGCTPINPLARGKRLVHRLVLRCSRQWTSSPRSSLPSNSSTSRYSTFSLKPSSSLSCPLDMFALFLGVLFFFLPSLLCCGGSLFLFLRLSKFRQEPSLSSYLFNVAI